MKCKFCNTIINEVAFDLGNTAPSNRLINPENLMMKEMTYPLLLYVCPNCFLTQIDEQLDGNEIFDKNYVYFSSASKNWLEHSKKFSEMIIKRLSLNKNSFVVEIASNDGYLLKNFVDKKINCLGIDPTENTSREALIKGIPTLVDFFTHKLSEKFVLNDNLADLIIANNVLAHVPNINDFVSALKNLLKDNGTITIEFPHLLELVKHCEFDTIYHEHYFYFSLYSLKIIFNKYDLSIYDVEKLTTHGGSLRIYLTHKDNILDKSHTKIRVNSILNEEIENNLNSVNFSTSISKNALQIKLNSLNFILSQKQEKKKIAAFGAAAKGNTFLNYLGLKNDIIDFIVDETPFKIGKFTPQSKIPIVTLEKLKLEKPDIIIILPWNHKNEIIKKILFVKNWGAKIVTFIPKLEIY